MDSEFKFSIIKSRLYADNNHENTIFDINKFSTVSISFDIVPLHNFHSSLERDHFDQMIFEKLEFITSLVEVTPYNRNVISLLISSSDLEKNIDKSIYQVNAIFHKNLFDFELKDKTYEIELGYYVGSNEFQDTREASVAYLREQKRNKLFSTFIPFEDGGEWLNGKF